MSDEIEKLKYTIQLINRSSTVSLMTVAENILIKRDIQKLIDKNTEQSGAHYNPLNIEKVKRGPLSDNELKINFKSINKNDIFGYFARSYFAGFREAEKIHNIGENTNRLSDNEIAEMWGDEYSGKQFIIKNFARKIEEETLKRCGVICNTIC